MTVVAKSFPYLWVSVHFVEFLGALVNLVIVYLLLGKEIKVPTVKNNILSRHMACEKVKSYFRPVSVIFVPVCPGKCGEKCGTESVKREHRLSKSEIYQFTNFSCRHQKAPEPPISAFHFSRPKYYFQKIAWSHICPHSFYSGSRKWCYSAGIIPTLVEILEIMRPTS